MSLWEIAIKVRIGKLAVSSPLLELVATCKSFKMGILAIEAHHVLSEIEPVPPTRDPFDRLLLAQAACEGMALVTLDRALAGHPREWRGSR